MEEQTLTEAVHAQVLDGIITQAVKKEEFVNCISSLFEIMNNFEELMERNGDEITEDVQEELEETYCKPLREQTVVLNDIAQRLGQLTLNNDDEEEEEEGEYTVDCDEEALEKFAQRDYNALRLRALEKFIEEHDAADGVLDVTKETVETNDDEDYECNISDNIFEDDGS